MCHALWSMGVVANCVLFKVKKYEPGHGTTSSALAFLDYGCVAGLVTGVVGVVE